MAKGKYDEQVKSRFYDIEQWLNEGLSEKQIITNLGIGKTSWESYKHKYPELVELIKKGSQTQVTEVVNSLFKNATGYYYYIEEAVKVKDADGREHLEKISLKKFSKPETGAIAFFLKNKDKMNWQDNPRMIDAKYEELELRRKESDFRSW
jgi:hypothetical protein